MPISCADCQSRRSVGHVAIAVPWFAALIVAVYRRHVRVIGFLAALVSVVACALLLGAAPARRVAGAGLDASVFLPHSGRDPGASPPRLQPRGRWPASFSSSDRRCWLTPRTTC